jgi:hypothetical protein
MTSGRKTAANRANTKRSTGPRTTGGKQRSSRNARRHGLSARAEPTPFVRARIEQLTNILAGPAPSTVRRELAAMVADAQFDLFRIRSIKISILERGEYYLNDATTEAPLPDNDASRTIEMSRRALPELLTLDRYEQRALSRTAVGGGMWNIGFRLLQCDPKWSP